MSAPIIQIDAAPAKRLLRDHSRDGRLVLALRAHDPSAMKLRSVESPGCTTLILARAALLMCKITNKNSFCENTDSAIHVGFSERYGQARANAQRPNRVSVINLWHSRRKVRFLVVVLSMHTSHWRRAVRGKKHEELSVIVT